ncbi:GTPase Era [Aedoeadaptatus acetigenes]|uniref:GTPase Era n=1 Tax=Aedoeadaptatus acetigenes TaxID=2981723 RepID=A0ABV1J664_9FIRM|nr:GTPase Era [Aedoeadaptatus acetigenes]MCU6787203.1 GTPase Era [Aedoeadaptatus acetigenes]
MHKSGFVSVVGRPNVGKSTLLNRILKEKLSITSNKAQTTRNKITMIHTDDRGQIIFLDTPGIQSPKNKLGDYMLKTSVSSMEGVDVILMVVDMSDYLGPKDQMILDAMEKEGRDIPAILVINKVDVAPRDEVLPIIAKFAAMNRFEDIVPVSALNDENVDHLVDVIFEHLPEGPQYFPEDMITDQPEKFIVAELIREKGLFYLRDEVPHGLAVSVDSMKEVEGKDHMDIQATIYVERDSHKGIIIGKNGQMLKRIGTEARKEIEAFLGEHVNLRLWVKVSKNWREKDEKVKAFGYKAD